MAERVRKPVTPAPTHRVSPFYRVGNIDIAARNASFEGMKPTGENHSFVLPPALLAEVEAAANDEHRPVADVVRDLVESGLGERRWKALVEKEIQQGRELGLPDNAGVLTDAYRQDLREKIAQGMQSLREGKGTDGEAFMAQMDAELAELERQGR